MRDERATIAQQEVTDYWNNYFKWDSQQVSRNRKNFFRLFIQRLVGGLGIRIRHFTPCFVFSLVASGNAR